MEIALVRHGQTEWNLAERVQGRTDIPLNDTGREQARRAGDQLLADGEAWDLIVSSPLSRARETASIIAETLGVPLGDAHAGLTEQDFGAGEGLPVTEMYGRWPDRDIPDGESDPDVGARGLRALDGIAGAYPAAARVLAVSHGSLIRGTIAFASGLAYLQVPRIENTAVSVLRRRTAWQVLTVGGVPLDQAVRADRGALT